MKLSYHLSAKDLEKIISDYFDKQGKKVNKCEFMVAEGGAIGIIVNIVTFQKLLLTSRRI